MNIQGLSNVDSVGKRIEIKRNPLLTSLKGLDQISTLSEFLIIWDNASLENLDGLVAVRQVGNLLLSHNTSLTQTNLHNLSRIEYEFIMSGNNDLENLDGFSNLNFVGYGLEITQNMNLSNFCSLQTLVQNGFNGEYNVLDNALNPSQTDLFEGKCE